MKAKSLATPLLILLVSFTACAQHSSLDQFYEKYHSTGNKDDISFDPSFLLNISFNGSNPASPAGSAKDKPTDWSRKITSLRCLSIDAAHAQEWADLSRTLKKDNFEEWFSVRKGKGRLQLLSRDGKEGPEEVVCLIVGEEGNGLFFHLRGHFTATDKARMQISLQDQYHDEE
jgi:hypothetical protein